MKTLSRFLFVLIGLIVLFFQSCTINSLPNAVITVDSNLGTTETVFTFDASQSSDLETPTEEIIVKWDFENDGIFDTEYETEKQATHQYSEVGIYTVVCQIMDGGYLTDEASIQVEVEEGGSSFDGTFEYDGKSYKYKTIGQQVWMIENLAYLPQISSSDHASKEEPGYYVYGYMGDNVSEAKSQANYSLYGVLYNFAAASVACPPGWHLPTDNEWGELEAFLGMSEEDVRRDMDYRESGQVGSKLKYTSGWNDDGNGTNESGFRAIPGGMRDNFGDYESIGNTAHFWTARDFLSSSAYLRSLAYTSDGVGKHFDWRDNALSVRCVKD